MTNSNDKALAILKECDAIREGHFILASGNHSGHYVQVAMLAQHPRKLQQAMESAVDILRQDNTIDTVMTAAIGGIPVGQTLAALLDAKSIFAERNSENQMIMKRGFTIAQGEKVLLVEDVMTTGGTLIELKKIVNLHQGKVVGIFTVVNRTGKDQFEGHRIISVMDINFPVYKPDACPLCQQGIPAVRPGTKKV